jgi:hypothetical protein
MGAPLNGGPKTTIFVIANLCNVEPFPLTNQTSHAAS